MIKTDFVVVGAGIAGASVAAELSVDHRVYLLEAETQPGYHSTGRSAALFSETYGNKVIRGLSRASRRQLFEPLPAFGAVPWTSPRGALFVATCEQSDRLAADAEQEDIRDSARPLSASETLGLCPILRSSYVASGLYEPDASDIDVHGLHQAYLKQFRRNGGQLMTSSRVVSFERTGALWEIRTPSETFVAPVVINAAGAWADQLAELAGAEVAGLQPMRRTAIRVEAPAGQTTSRWPLVVGADETFYFKPDGGLLLLSPADETPTDPCDAQPDEWDIAVAVERVIEAADIEIKRIRARWAGLRTFAKDRSPVVGFDIRARGFFWLAGQGGYGVQTAPALAVVAAALCCEKPIPPWIADFGVDAATLSPARFAGAARG